MRFPKNNWTGIEESADGSSSLLNPEWIRVADACAYSGISKPKLYQLLNRGLIKSVSLRERGQIKGTRLISADSLRNFLESRATGGEQPENK